LEKKHVLGKDLQVQEYQEMIATVKEIKHSRTRTKAKMGGERTKKPPRPRKEPYEKKGAWN